MAGQGRKDMRSIAPDDSVSGEILCDFLLGALRHPVLSDALIDRMAAQADRDRLDAKSLSVVLPEMIAEVFDAATAGDWMAIADLLIEDMREACSKEAE